MLGGSPDRDAELLRRMTGLPVDAKPSSKVSSDSAERTFSAVLRAADDRRIVVDVTYGYRLTKEDAYRPSVRLGIGKEFACIRMDHLLEVLGPPQNVLTFPPPHAKKTGPSDVWTVRYVFNQGFTSSFHFLSEECASYFTLFADSQKQRIK